MIAIHSTRVIAHITRRYGTRQAIDGSKLQIPIHSFFNRQIRRNGMLQGGPLSFARWAINMAQSVLMSEAPRIL